MRVSETSPRLAGHKTSVNCISYKAGGTVDKDKLSIERNREHSIQLAIHPPKQEQKQENQQ